ncbi:MAG: ABC transporter substrate-binding protein [Hyphomicrobiales bacterium]
MKKPETHAMSARKLLAATLLSGAIFASAIPTTANAESIEFWTHTYGDQIKWKNAITGLAEEFEEESGIEVNHEILPWKVSSKTWLTIAQSGAHPDCADMYWLHSFSAIGGDKFGPMPINEHREKFATLEQDFYSGALQDVFWKDDFYGIPWRGDIRAILYRTDTLEEAGLTKAPETWDEVVDAAKKMTNPMPMEI